MLIAMPAGDRSEAMAAGAKKNWSANITYCSTSIASATSIAEIQALLNSSPKIKPFGTGHTFNSITDTLHTRLSLLPAHSYNLDASARTVTIPAGVRYDELCPFLHTHGYALANSASILELSVVGAVSTGAHGSGVRCGNLATSVAGVELVAPGSGEVVKLSRKENAFFGVVVGLGAVGVVTKVTMDVEPQFDVRQWVYLDLSIDVLRKEFEVVMALGWSVSAFTDWQGGRISQLWIKCRAEDPFTAPELLFGATRQTHNVNMNFGAHVEHCTEQMGVPGPSHERLPHFRPGHLSPTGNELQSEYFLPRRHAPAAIAAIESLRDSITPHLFISEIRSIAADEFWMSPCYKRDSVSIHFTWKHHEADVKRLLPVIERALAPFDPRPHWGKMFAMAPGVLQSKYPKIEEFRRLARRFDPEGKLRNSFLDVYVFEQELPSPTAKL